MDKWDLFVEAIRRAEPASPLADADLAALTRLLKGPKGDRGEGIKGDPGEKGRDGVDGKDGRDGKDGADGINGLDGQPGQDGVDGKDGRDGKDSVAEFHFEKGAVLRNPTGPMTVGVWKAPYPCIVTAVCGCRVGGGLAAVNAKKRGGSPHLAEPLWLREENVWTAGGAVQDPVYRAGETLEVQLVSGSGGDIAVQVEFRRA